MEKKERLKKLKEAEKDLIPKSKFWNQNSVFLGFAFGSAIMLMTSIELFRIWAKDYSFNFQNLSLMIQDYYFLGILMFFIFGLFIAIVLGKKIDNACKDIQKILKIVKDEIKELRKK